MVDSTFKVDRSSLPTPQTGYASLLFTWDEQLRAVALREGQALLVGRSQPAELMIPDPSLSRVHARLSLHDGKLLLEDLESTNGCMVNGKATASACVCDDDSISLGSVQLRICSQPPLRVPSAVLTQPSFLRRLSEELTRSRLFGRCTALVALKHGEDECVRECVLRALGPLDSFGAYAPGLGLVLLPERDEQGARAWASALLAELPHARAGFAAYPHIACGAEALVSCALDACHRTSSADALRGGLPPPADERGPLLISPAMRRLYGLVERVAVTSLPVLIQGETGTGKELVARALHEKSARQRAPFRALNCATIPTNLVESVLFGHERGSFSGAERRALGVFEFAQHGTVFLDEIGELSLPAQAALLRVLEDRRLVRVGSNVEIEADVRVVAATHRDLAAMAANGTFRSDLMFRLDAVSLRVPPLRQRREEIIPLAELFLARARSQWHVKALGFSEDARSELLDYGWPGNVRQLKNVTERAAAICINEEIEPEDLAIEVWEEAVETSGPEKPSAQDAPRALPERLREFEIGIVRDAMTAALGNQSQAAHILGIPRRTLVSKIRTLGLRSSKPP